MTAAREPIERALGGIDIAVDGRYARRPGIGIHRYLLDAVELLIEVGARVTMLVNFPIEEVSHLAVGATWESFGSHRNLVWEQWDLPCYLRRRRFDCYWAPGNFGIPWQSVGPTWTISTTHDLVPLRLWRMYLIHQPLYAIPYLIWTSAAVLRSDTLLTVSDASARDLGRITRRSVSVVPSALHRETTATEASELPASLAGRHYVIYTGGFDPRKNIDNLLRGFRLAHQTRRDLALVITGDPPLQVTARIESLDLTHCVVLTGYVPEEMKRALLQAASVLAYPSLYEGFGLPLIEAFANDLPVVTSRGSALEEVAGDAAVFADPHQPASIADAILEALDPHTADRLRAHGRRRMLAYDPEVSRALLVDLISSSVAWPRASSAR